MSHNDANPPRNYTHTIGPDQDDVDFRQLVESQSDMVVKVDTQGRFLYVSPSYCRTFGKSREELLGASFMLAVHEDDREATERAMEALWRSPHTIYMEQRAKTAAGWRWFSWQDTAVLDHDGRVLAIIGVGRDISEQRLDKEALLKSENHFRSLFETMHEGFAYHEVICNDVGGVVDYRYLDINPAFEQLTGLKRATTVGRTVREVLPDIEEEWIQCFGTVALTGISAERESYVQELDRYYRARAYSPEKGKFAVVFEETTAQRRAQRELERREALYNDLVETATDLVWRCDNEGRYTFLNHAWETAFGYTLDEMLGHRFTDFMTSEQAERDSAIFAQLLSTTGQVTGHETVHLRKDGPPVWLAFNARFFHDDAGKIIGTQGTAHDITERRLAEHALAESELLYRNLVETTAAVAWEVDVATLRFAYISPQIEKLSGYPPEQWTDFNFWVDSIHPDDRAEAIGFCQTETARGLDHSFDYRLIAADGRIVWVRDVVSVTCKDGKPTTLRGYFIDITERKQAEEERHKLERQLLHAQKLESLGVLAGGIAHDFNNILTAIIGNAELALMKLNPESPALENLGRIEKAAARAADLARQMLAYSGKGRFVIEAIDLNRLVEEMGHMLEVSISKKAVLRYNLTRPLPAVNVDATQIRQIIMNLVINASEAIGDRSGVIAITTGCLECNEAYLQEFWLTDPIPEGLYVSLEIADSGCGMDRETLGKIFDPFFTTKFTGRGLGMAAVLGIVRGHKGAIKVYSEPGKGSSFKVLLPAGEKPAELFNGEATSDSWRGSGTALLVDDEETVRAIGSEMLKELGLDVITARDGREAVEIFKAEKEISVVILDLTMPHMDGEQCFRELRMMDPAVKVVMSSGFSEHEVTQKFAGKGLAGFVQKPYKLSVLSDVIRGVCSNNL